MFKTYQLTYLRTETKILRASSLSDAASKAQLFANFTPGIKILELAHCDIAPFDPLPPDTNQPPTAAA